jgi:hypothetical protein
METRQAERALNVSRRDLLRITSGALAGAALWGSGRETAMAAPRRPNRGGTLRFATRGDASGLDPQRIGVSGIHPSRDTLYPQSLHTRA